MQHFHFQSKGFSKTSPMSLQITPHCLWDWVVTITLVNGAKKKSWWYISWAKYQCQWGCRGRHRNFGSCIHGERLIWRSFDWRGLSQYTRRPILPLRFEREVRKQTYWTFFWSSPLQPWWHKLQRICHKKTWITTIVRWYDWSVLSNAYSIQKISRPKSTNSGTQVIPVRNALYDDYIKMFSVCDRSTSKSNIEHGRISTEERDALVKVGAMTPSRSDVFCKIHSTHIVI